MATELQNINFFFNYTAEEDVLVERLASQITLYHPNSKFLARPGDKEKRIAYLGCFLQQNYEFVLSNCDSDCVWIVKLDPDSYLQKPLSVYPKQDWNGLVRRKKLQWGFTKWVHGGGWIIKKEALEKIVSSNLLLHPRYFYQHSFEKQLNRNYSDCRMGHVANLLNIKLAWWKDYSNYNDNIEQIPKTDAAIIHPVKYL